MNYNEPILGDCWVDAQGHHWFCKKAEISYESPDVKEQVFMVKYITNGFVMRPISTFISQHPEAKLYMREGIHPGA